MATYVSKKYMFCKRTLVNVVTNLSLNSNRCLILSNFQSEYQNHSTRRFYMCQLYF